MGCECDRHLLLVTHGAAAASLVATRPDETAPVRVCELGDGEKALAGGAKSNDRITAHAANPSAASIRGNMYMTAPLLYYEYRERRSLLWNEE